MAGGRDYETGWGDGNSAGGDYATVGEGEGEVGLPAIQLYRPPAARQGAPPARQQPAYRPAPAVAAGPTPAQVRAIVREEISRAVPYGDVPPRPNAEEAMFPMGLGAVTLTSAIPRLFLTARPQRAFRGERLVLAVQRSAGATGVIAVIEDFLVGDYKQLVGGGSLPVDVFAADSFGVRLMLDASVPGVLYSIEISAVVPPGEFVLVTGAVIGRAGEAAQR